MRRILDQTLGVAANRRRVRECAYRRNDLVRRPAAAKRLIKGYETVACKPDDIGTLLFQGELLPLRVENVEEIGQAAVVALGRHPRRLARRLDGGIQAAQALAVSAIGRVGLVNLLYRDQDGLLVDRRELVRPVVGDLDFGIESAEVEERRAERRTDRTQSR